MIPKKYRIRAGSFKRKSDKFLIETKKLLEKNNETKTLYYYCLQLELEKRGIK